MTVKEFRTRKSALRSLYEQSRYEQAEEAAHLLVQELHESKKYRYIAELFHSKFLQPKASLYTFEVAYSLNEEGCVDEAERIYQSIVDEEPQNSAALNNLSNIKKQNGLVDEAFDLIRRAYEVDPQDEIVSRNYESLLSVYSEKEEINRRHKHALTYLARENEFVIGKLRSFVVNAKNDPDFRDNQMPIPRWKFRVLMGTDQQKADSLLEQWLAKGYLRETGDRGYYNERVYELNPLLSKALADITPAKVNPKWIAGINELNAERLEELSYFSIVKQVGKVKRRVRTILLRDLNELFLNYLMKNDKSVVVLAGSLVELLLIYQCEKKGIRQISYHRNGKTVRRKLHECDLGDLLTFFEQNKLMGDIVVHMGNISRIYRNFVHPGKELRSTESINQAKADLCFISAMEIVKAVCA